MAYIERPRVKENAVLMVGLLTFKDEGDNAGVSMFRGREVERAFVFEGSRVYRWAARTASVRRMERGIRLICRAEGNGMGMGR